MELQENLATLQTNGIEPYAISYDSVEILGAFADKYGITYPLLSDSQSQVIRAFGLFNELIPVGHAWYGVPFPGTYMVDAQGLVSDKSFHANHGVRDSVAGMLQESFHVEPDGRPVQSLENDALKAVATLSSGTIRPGQVQIFTLDIALKADLHLYAPQTAGGYIATQLTFDPVEEVQIAEVAYPAAETMTILDEEIAVYTGRLRLKTTVRSRRKEDFALRAHLDYQACDEGECYMPQRLDFELSMTCIDNIWQ